MTASRSKIVTAALSRRERQIMDVLYGRGPSSVSEVVAGLPDPPSYDSVRTILRVLERKGHVEHRQEGRRYVYRPAISTQRAARRALRHCAETFFSGSAEAAALTLLKMADGALPAEELERLERMIDEAEARGD